MNGGFIDAELVNLHSGATRGGSGGMATPALFLKIIFLPCKIGINNNS